MRTIKVTAQWCEPCQFQQPFHNGRCVHCSDGYEDVETVVFEPGVYGRVIAPRGVDIVINDDLSTLTHFTAEVSTNHTPLSPLYKRIAALPKLWSLQWRIMKGVPLKARIPFMLICARTVLKKNKP